ncbi:MAG: hypothetical protein ACLQFM_20015, partial [Terriglobales bacterium]
MRCATLLLVAAFSAVVPGMAQKATELPPEDWLHGITAGRNVVVDMTYPVNEKFPAWPGDDHVFEAKVSATMEKDGYFTR